MLNFYNIEETLYNWVTTVEPTIPAIFAHANAPRPTLPYVLINITQAVQIGTQEHDDTLLVDDTVDVGYSTVNDIFVSINVYGADAMSRATKLKDSITRITILESLYEGGLGFSRATTVNEIPEEVNKQWEDRAQFDCFFYIRSLDEENIESIQKIEVNNEVYPSLISDLPISHNFLSENEKDGWLLSGNPSVSQTDEDRKLTTTVNNFNQGVLLRINTKEDFTYSFEFDFVISGNTIDEQVYMGGTPFDLNSTTIVGGSIGVTNLGIPAIILDNTPGEINRIVLSSKAIFNFVGYGIVIFSDIVASGFTFTIDNPTAHVITVIE